MRPYPDEILQSLSLSMRDEIIPYISDPWARYVARNVEKLLAHLQLRWQNELDFLSQDSAETRALFQQIGASLDGLAEPLKGPVREILQTYLASAANHLDTSGLAARLNREDAESRSAFAQLIEAYYAARRSASSDDVSALDRIYAQLRAQLSRQLDRDLQLAGPAFMTFGPPPPADGAIAEQQHATGANAHE